LGKTQASHLIPFHFQTIHSWSALWPTPPRPLDINPVIPSSPKNAQPGQGRQVRTVPCFIYLHVMQMITPVKVGQTWSNQKIYDNASRADRFRPFSLAARPGPAKPRPGKGQTSVRVGEGRLDFARRSGRGAATTTIPWPNVRTCLAAPIRARVRFDTAPKIGGANLLVCGLSWILKLVGTRAAPHRRATGGRVRTYPSAPARPQTSLTPGNNAAKLNLH